MASTQHGSKAGRVLALLLSVTTLVLAAAPAAVAADPAAEDQETALREKANALMASSNWSEALPIWAQLYGSGAKPLDLWNAAVCQYHRAQTGQATPDQALALLRQYRDSPNVSDEKKAKAQRYIDEMTALGQQKATPPPPAPAAPAAAPTVVVVAAPAESAHAPQQEHPGTRIAAWTAGGIGAATLAAGIYFSLRTHSLESQVSNETMYSASNDDAGHQAETLQFVMYGISVAAIATASILYYLAPLKHASSSVALHPVAGPGQAGALVSVRF
jgi:hypothetical protein